MFTLWQGASSPIQGGPALLEGELTPVRGKAARIEGNRALDPFLFYFICFSLASYARNRQIAGMGGAPRKSSERLRSPAYPHISLPDAVWLVQKIRPVADGSHAVSLSAAAEALELAPESSWLNLRLAALKKFGLIEDLPAGETRERRVRLTSTAVMLGTIPHYDVMNRVLRQQAALRPPIYEDLWNRFGPILPANEPMREYLVKERQFNPQSVDALLDNFRSTVEYAELMESALTFEEAVAAITNDAGQGKNKSPRKSPLSLALERMKSFNEQASAASGPILGESLLNLSAAQLRARVEQSEAATGRRTTFIPLDGNEDAMLQFPRAMTAQRWQTIIDTLELWKKQAKSE